PTPTLSGSERRQVCVCLACRTSASAPLHASPAARLAPGSGSLRLPQGVGVVTLLEGRWAARICRPHRLDLLSCLDSAQRVSERLPQEGRPGQLSLPRVLVELVEELVVEHDLYRLHEFIIWRSTQESQHSALEQRERSTAYGA